MRSTGPSLASGPAALKHEALQVAKHDLDELPLTRKAAKRARHCAKDRASLCKLGGPAHASINERMDSSNVYDGAVKGIQRVSTIALALSLSLPAPTAWAGITPEQAQQQRDEVQGEASSLAAAAAVELLQREAEERGDPELFLSASERLRQRAEVEADEDLAHAAGRLASTARDIALYLADERRFAATDWQVVTRERASELADEAEQAMTKANELADAIVAAKATESAEPSPVDDEPERTRKPGTALIAGGAAALTIGVGGLAMIGAGMGIGGNAQKEAESLDLPAEQARLDELDRKGAQANLITYVGIAVAGVGLASGIALIAVGVKKRGRSDDARASLRAAPWFGREAAGLAIGGRF